VGIEQVIQEAQSRRLLREQTREQARASFLALDKADRAEMLGEFADIVMADKAASNEPPPRSAPAPPAPAPSRPAPAVLASATEPKRSKTDQAEELVRTRPGITTKEIAAHIEQSPRTAGSTLAQLAKNRGSISSKDGAWYPVTSKTSKTTEGSGSKVRDSIIEVMNNGVARGTGDIIRAVTARDPDINKNSINAQVHRMLHLDPPLLIKRGEGEHGPLYVLASAEDKDAVFGGTE
jgi:hypothetical protein